MSTPATIALVLLTYDELDGVRFILPQLPDRAELGVDEIFAVDGGSTDGTLEVLATHQVPVHLQQSRGRGNALRLAAAKTSCSHLVFFSPDGNEDWRDIPLSRLLRAGLRSRHRQSHDARRPQRGRRSALPAAEVGTTKWIVWPPASRTPAPISWPGGGAGPILMEAGCRQLARSFELRMPLGPQVREEGAWARFSMGSNASVPSGSECFAG